MKTSENIESLIQIGKSRAEFNGDSRAKRNGSELDGSMFDNSEVDDGELGDSEVKKKVQKSSKSKNLSKYKKTIGSDFFTLRARLVFTKLR